MIDSSKIIEASKELMRVREKINQAYIDPLSEVEMAGLDEARHILWNLAFTILKRAEIFDRSQGKKGGNKVASVAERQKWLRTILNKGAKP
jgi:hypothetical protein